MELLLPLATFAFVSTITPGPNNLMLSASGIAFGMRRTLPHLFGVWIGFALLVVLCGAGLGTLMAGMPRAGVVLKVVGTAYLLVLAWRMRDALTPRDVAPSGRPLTFLEAVAFQFVNPKAWFMSLTAVSVFMPPLQPQWFAVLTVAAVYALVGLPCISTWALLGAGLRRQLADARLRRVASAAVAVLMVYSAGAIWI